MWGCRYLSDLSWAPRSDLISYSYWVGPVPADRAPCSPKASSWWLSLPGEGVVWGFHEVQVLGHGELCNSCLLHGLKGPESQKTMGFLQFWTLATWEVDTQALWHELWRQNVNIDLPSKHLTPSFAKSQGKGLTVMLSRLFFIIVI